MSSVGVGTGHPDDEARPMPHGGTLDSGSAFSVNGTKDFPGLGAFVEVAGYRSLVVVVNNKGTRDLTVTPRWDFFEGPGNLNTTEAQIVPAGTSRRLLFQNRGDIVNRIRVTGGGAGDTIDYHVVPSNLDPLASSAPDTIALWGVDLPIPAVAGGFSGQTPWSVASVQKTGTDVWSFTLNGAGDIEQVLASAPGIYEVHCSFHFDAPSAVTAETCVANIFGTIPIPVQQSGVAAILTTGIFEGMVGALTHFQSGAAIFTIQANFDRATTGLFRGVEWWIKRWAL